MKHFAWLESSGVITCMSGLAEGDCGWDGCATGTRQNFLDNAPFPGERLVVLRQCHGDAIQTIQLGDAGKGACSRESSPGVGDGLMTCHPDIPLGVIVADCVPLFLFGDGVVAAVHAGRVGTELNIASRAEEAVFSTYGVPPEHLFALIGPSAGPCCYKVGPDVLEGAVAKRLVARGDHLDLWETNRQQLQRAGLPDAHISLDACCTICSPGFYSYRKHGTAERNLAVIMLRNTGTGGT